jgi:hypothetical protein
VKVKIIIEQSLTLDPETITDPHVKNAILRMTNNKHSNNIDKFWIQNWVMMQINPPSSVKVEIL